MPDAGLSAGNALADIVDFSGPCLIGKMWAGNQCLRLADHVDLALY
jgi:hypothetical protein